ISREEQLLDTGGGLKKASWFFLQDSAHAEEPFILHNVDVISTINLRRMLAFHNEKQALATLAVQHRESSRQLLFDADLRLCGRRIGPGQDPELVRSRLTHAFRQGTASAVPKSVGSPGALAPEVPPQPFAFSGIHIISPRLLQLMPEQDAFSIIDTYLHLSARGEKIFAFPADDAYWRDLGKPVGLAQAAKDLKKRVWF